MTKKALLIGIDNYQTSPLRGCVNDANRLSDLLTSSHSKFEAIKLLDEEATRASIRENLLWLLKECEIAIFYFAGHGWRRPTGTYLVTHDSQIHDEGIELSWLANAIKSLRAPSTNVVIILDACHSGDGSIRDHDPMHQDLTAADLQPLISNGGTRLLMAACKGAEVALEITHNNVNHGAFTHFLCEALEGYAANEEGDVTVNSIFDYVSIKLHEQGRQTPVLRGDQEGQFRFASGVTKLGGWKNTRSNQMLPSEAISKADDLLANIHGLMSIKSFEEWQKKDYGAACSAFEPVLNWFKRRDELQPELFQNKEFLEKYSTCTHMHKHLCAISPGVVLSSGKFLGSIGSGSFGSVWKIAAGGWATPVCFKAYHPHDILDNEKQSRFRRGYQAMKQLDHPNIVKVRALSEVPFGFFMDYIEGANLRQLNPGAATEPEVIINLLLEVAETLQHAHGRGVIHRDVKPENIVVAISEQNEYSAFLTDFDLAWFSAATQVTKLADGFGSHFYAAPEQINSPQSASAHRSTVDVYAFGQLIFFCICGRDPMAFDRTSNAQALEDALGRKFHDARASAEISRLFKECVEISPPKRIQDFRTICERLAKIQIAITAQPESYSIDRFIEQLGYLLSGKFSETPISSASSTVRSRSNRTGIDLRISKDAPEVCAIEAAFHPNSLLIEGKKASDVRSIVNNRIDMMLVEFKRNHDVVRKGNKVGAFEFSLKIDRLPKNQDGVLIARKIILKTIDLIEQA